MRYKFVNIFTMPFIDAALIIIQFEVWAHKTCLPPPMFIEVHVLSHESEWLCICVLGVSILPLSTICFIGFWDCSDIVVFFVFFM